MELAAIGAVPGQQGSFLYNLDEVGTSAFNLDEKTISLSASSR